MILERKHQDFITAPLGLLPNSFSLEFFKNSFWVNQQHSSEFFSQKGNSS